MPQLYKASRYKTTLYNPSVQLNLIQEEGQRAKEAKDKKEERREANAKEAKKPDQEQKTTMDHKSQIRMIERKFEGSDSSNAPGKSTRHSR